MGPYLAVGSIVLAMAMLALGNGLLLTFTPIRLHDYGVGAGTIGWVVTAYAVGMFAGCALSGWTVRRVGHIRAFAAFASVNALCAMALSAESATIAWLGFRTLQGFCSNSLFLVAQSWINELTENQHRGRVMALFYVAYVVAAGGGAFTVALIDTRGADALLLPAALSVLSVVMVVLTRAQSPPPPEAFEFAPRRVFAISPVGVIGVFVAGAMAMTFYGIGPVYATAVGLGSTAIGTMMAAVQVGNLAIQWPLGLLSDRTDRRLVVIAASLLAAAASCGLVVWGAQPFWLLLVLVALFSGGAESLYSVSAAHTNDYAASGDHVAVASTLLMAWSLGSALGPLAATAAMSQLGPRGLFVYLLAVAFPFAMFVAIRRLVREREPPPDALAGEPPAHPLTSAWVPVEPEPAEQG